MRAWEIHRHGPPPDALRATERPLPVPGPGEVRLRVLVAAVGMPDAFMCRDLYAFRPELPFVAGQEVCGVVDAVGPGVDPEDLAVGSRVMAVTRFDAGHGGFAEHALARADSAYRVPADMSDRDAAGFRIGCSTGWIGLVRRGRLQAGESLVVLGAAGGSGSTAVQIGRALDARVIAVVGGPEKAAFCRRLGAEVVVDRREGSVAEAVREAAGGAGVDVVYDPVGGVAANSLVRTLAPGGRLLAVGYASGEWVRPDTATLVRRNAALVGVFAGGLTRAENEADHEALLALAADGRLGGVTSAWSFDDLPAAVAAVDHGEVVGKAVVEVASA